MTAWYDRIYCASSENMSVIPDASVGLAFTSPPYNCGMAYDRNLSLNEHLGLIERVGREVYRTMLPGGRYVVNVANLWRKPYLPLDAYLWPLHERIGFLPAGEVIWVKARAASGSCAWGSWRSAQAPVLRDVHERLLVLAKEGYRRPDRGESTISGPEFVSATLSVWEIPPESARRKPGPGRHPAPFPLALAERAISLWSYAGDVVLDPFAGSGTTCLAAHRLGRRYVGFDVVPEYVALAEARIASGAVGAVVPGTPAHASN